MQQVLLFPLYEVFLLAIQLFLSYKKNVFFYLLTQVIVKIYFVLVGHRRSLDVATISQGTTKFFSVLMLAWGTQVTREMYLDMKLVPEIGELYFWLY